MRALGPIVALAFVTAVVATGRLRRFALAKGMLDIPNERSSHTVAVPRGGGLSILLAVTLAVSLLIAARKVPAQFLLALFAGGIAVAVVGFADDRLQLSVKARLAVHVSAATLAVYCLGSVTTGVSGDHLQLWNWAGYAIGILGVVWFLNLFNFMDGIDGLAASEGVFMCAAGAWLGWLGGLPDWLIVSWLIVAAACGGFLLWNWPPARIFMGDVGSGYVGYAIAVLGIAGLRYNPIMSWSWLILGATFITDANVTIAGRLLRGEKVYQAHRTHAYQQLSMRWAAHAPVTVLYMAVNLLWLLPAAWLALKFSSHASLITLIAYIPVLMMMLFLGAGRAAKQRAASDPEAPR